MNNAVGFLELNSIAKGVEATDILLKTADVRLVFAKASCPGKYYILFTGEVAAVRSSMEAGTAVGGGNVVDTCVIPNIDPQVVKAVNMTSYPENMESIGVMEFYSVTASVYSADAAVKAADVELVDVRLGTGIGGGIIVGGKILAGSTGAGGEIGHIHVNDDETETCGCGNRGCLEQYSSATGITKT